VRADAAELGGQDRCLEDRQLESEAEAEVEVEIGAEAAIAVPATFVATTWTRRVWPRPASTSV
jgi:hypothetical protein